MRLKSVQDEKDYYKSRATEAKEDLDRVKSELDYLRRALDSENRALVNELAELRLKTKSTTTSHPTISTTHTLIHTPTNTIPTPTEIIINAIEMDMPEPLMDDVWSSSRIRQRSGSSGKALMHFKKKRTVQDLHEVRQWIKKQETTLY